MRLFIFVSAIFLSQFIWAGMTDNQIEFKIEKNKITLTPKRGFHLNDKAPASATYDNLKAIYRPQIKTEQKFEYNVLPKIKKVNLKFFVCDDAKTVCEQQEQSLQMLETSAAPSSTNGNHFAATIPIENTDAQKYLHAKKPTLLIFSAPWCPACIRMKTETYLQKSVQKVFSKLNVQNFNIDLVENEKISSQFQVKAIPSLILLNTKGQEIYRWLDYQPADKFAQELASESKNTESAEQLKAKADGGDLVATKKLAQIYLSQMNWASAVKHLSTLKDQQSLNQKLNAEISMLSDDKDKDEKTKKEYLSTLEKAIELSSSEVDRLRWKIEFFELKAENKNSVDKEAVQKIIFDLDKVLKNGMISKIYSESTIGDLSGFEKIETLDMRARAEALLGDNEAKASTQQEIIQQILTQKHNTYLPGQMINSIGYLSQAGAHQESEKLITRLVESYPKTYVYHQRYANFLLKQKRYPEALKKIETALEFKEGNEPQLNVAKIKILKALDKKSEALLLAEETLKLIEASPAKYKRTKTTLLDLKKEFLSK